jgi:SOS-response transcriptional repressor LexA
MNGNGASAAGEVIFYATAELSKNHSAMTNSELAKDRSKTVQRLSWVSAGEPVPQFQKQSRSTSVPLQQA